MEKIKLYLIVFCLMIASFFIGRDSNKPMWDIMDDERGCIIYWDDSTCSIKSKIHKLGTLKPGESKNFILDLDKELNHK